MNIAVNFKLMGVSLLLVAGLSACDKPGPAETAGKNLDQAAENVGDKMGDASDKVAMKMAEQSNKAGVAMDDTAITTKVKAAIFAEPGLRTLQISVDTVKGVVTLIGSVNSKADRDTAQSLAGAVSGVSSVNNQLSVK